MHHDPTTHSLICIVLSVVVEQLLPCVDLPAGRQEHNYFVFVFLWLQQAYAWLQVTFLSCAVVDKPAYIAEFVGGYHQQILLLQPTQGVK